MLQFLQNSAAFPPLSPAAWTDIERGVETGSIAVAKRIYVVPLEVNFLIVRYHRGSPIDVGKEAKAEAAAFHFCCCCQVLIEV